MKNKNLLFILLSFAWSVQSIQAHSTVDDHAKISVTEEATVYVIPDKATISFGVETNDKDVNVAKGANNAILVRALKAIQNAGIKEEDIRTTQISVDPRWDYVKQERQFSGYFVRNIFTVTVKEIEKTDTVIVEALNAGVNSMNGIDFQSSELEKHREEARLNALVNAKKKAALMVKALGQELGQPILINEQFQSAPLYSATPGLMQARAQFDNAGEAASTTIALGKIAIRSRVNVTFTFHNSISAE